MCDIDDGSYCELWSEKEIRARKSHRCDCCYRIINAGEKYIKHFSIFEGDITSEKICSECFDDRGEFAKLHDDITPSPGATKELIQECLHEKESLPLMLKWARMLKRIDSRKKAQ